MRNRTLTVIAAFSLVLLSAGAVSAESPRRIADEHRFGCTDKEYLKELVGYAADKDLEAFKQGLMAGILTGTCTLFEKGEQVYVVDTSILSGLVRVRRKGETKKYWTVLEAIRER